MRRRPFDSRSARRGLRLALSATLLAAVAACSTTTPVVHLHSLMPGDAASADAARARPSSVAPLAVVLDPVRMPSQVDQPQWLVQLPDGSLASLEQERWASPLRDEMRQAVLETLIVRHGAVELRHVAGAAARALRVDIDVRHFDSLPGREARMEGSWTIAPVSPSAMPSTTVAHCEWLIREPSAGSLAALAEAHRRAVSRLSDGVGTAMAAMRRGEPPKCPAADGPA